MKIKLLTICLLLFTSQVFAETWSCAYTWKGEAKVFGRTIKQNKIYEVDGTTISGEKIILNHKNFIHIYSSFPSVNSEFYAIVLDRVTKRFHMSFISGIKKHYANMEGECEISYE